MDEKLEPVADVVEGNKEGLPLTDDAANLDGAAVEAAKKGEVDAKVEDGIMEGAITEADRAKYNIPAKFKDWNSVIKWGSEAEKAKSKAEAEKGEIERRARELEEMIIESQSNPERKPAGDGVTDDDKAAAAAKFQEDFNRDPIGIMRNLFAEFKNQMTTEKQQTAQVSQWQREEDAIKSDPAYKDNWDSEVKPALIAIAKERPHLNSLDEVMAIYEHRKAKERAINADDTDKKKAAKAGASTETGRGAGAVSKDLMDKIANATTQDELDKLAAQIK